jgi:uncharacterized cupredoxin-like copper-binding protein
MSEYRFDAPTELPMGRAVFRVPNEGRIEHQMQVLQLPEDFPATFEEQFRSENRVAVMPIMSVPRQAPGATAVFALDLLPGRYGLVCFVVDPDGANHAGKGMTAMFTVR